MSKDLWIPPIKPDKDLIQKVVCAQMQDAVILEERKGGCYGVDCNNCILGPSYLPTFIIWTTFGTTQPSPNKKQFDLF